MAEVLRVNNLVKYFPVRQGFLGRPKGNIHAVDGVSLSLEENQTLGLVGESGCGKSTIGLCILRLIKPTSGEVWFEGQNLTTLPASELRRLRKNLQIVFQDPFGSLNPRMTVAQIIEEPLLNHANLSSNRRREKVAEALTMVGLLPEHANRFPHEFSGGQRQRICLARALILRPKVVICDEPVSALDVSVQAQVLNLLSRLQKELKLSYLFVSHDLAVIRHVSHHVAVMYLGQIVEKAPVKEIYMNPMHPYTQALLSAVPIPNPRKKRHRILLEGDVPSPLDPSPGCRFHPRCRHVMEICRETAPPLREIKTGHWTACHLYEDHPPTMGRGDSGTAPLGSPSGGTIN